MIRKIKNKEEPKKAKQTAFILSVGSDIGLALAKRYLNHGYGVIGTYRNFDQVKEIAHRNHCTLLYCDVSKKKSIEKLYGQFKKRRLRWNIFISCIGLPTP